MPRHLKPIRPERVVKIIAHTLPDVFERDEGDYELKWGHAPNESFYHDVVTLKKELQSIMPDTPKFPNRIEIILMKLQNFGKVFLNLETGEVF